jgi:hypothetical protein
LGTEKEEKAMADRKVRCGHCGKDISRLAKVLGTDPLWLLSHHLTAAHVWPGVAKLEEAVARFLEETDRHSLNPSWKGLRKALYEWRYLVMKNCESWKSSKEPLIPEGNDPAPAGGRVPR